MKIKSFTLTNFKSFKNSNNTVNPVSHINMIFGANNSGKSNILKFLNLVFQQKFSVQSIEVGNQISERKIAGIFSEGLIENEAFIFHKNKRSTDITFEFEIALTDQELVLSELPFYAEIKANYWPQGATEFILKFSGKISSIDQRSTSYIDITSTSLNGTQIFDGTKSPKEYFSSVQVLSGNKKAFDGIMSYLSGAVDYIDNNRYFVSEKAQIGDSTLEAHNLKNWLYNLTIDTFKYQQFEDLITFIKKYKVGKLADLAKLEISFSVDSDNNLELMLNRGEERLPISSFGTGISQILYILTRIFNSDSKIILIEELELNLSPENQREILRILKLLIDNNLIDQVFFTSHSNYFEARNDFGFYKVEINTSGESAVSKVTATREPFFTRRVID